MAPSFLRGLPLFSANHAHPAGVRKNNNPSWSSFGGDRYKSFHEPDEIPLSSSAELSHFDYKRNRNLKGSPQSKYGIKGGWKGGARLSFYTAAVVLFINVILIIVCSTALPKMDSMTMLYIGSCTKTERINAGVHFVVNFLSTALLAASNYCMQLLSAPTREDVDAAHARGTWLDIGIPSIRNLRFLKRKKIILWWILGISSLPLHLLYNSVFFSAIATNDYHILYATADFATGASYDKNQFPDTSSFNISAHQAKASTFDRFDRQECIKAYAQDFITDRKDVIVVVKNVLPVNGSLLKVASEVIPPTGLTPSTNSFSWICDDPLTIEKTNGCCNNTYGFTPCNRMSQKLKEISTDWWRSGGFDVDYCLSETFPPDCHEHFAPPIMAPVLFFNIFKALVIWYVAFRYSDKPLITVGDAIESFIRNPDPTTKHMCLATHEQIVHNWTKGYVPQPQRYVPHPHRWYRSVTKRQWFLLSALLTAATVMTIVGIVYGIENLNPSTIQQAWDMGMGTVRQQNLISGLKIAHLGSNALFLSALIANAPQALFSFIYLVYNTVFTSMFLGREWDRFATHPKGRILRVSEPVGDQKRVYILQIPYRYAIPMLITSGVLHWLVSQSIFLANISIIPLSGTKPLKDEITSCAYSVQGMIFVLVVGLAMIVWVVGNGLRSNPGLMVPAGSNSAAISAACHVTDRTGGERDAMILRPLRWGATDFGNGSNMKKRSVAGDSIVVLSNRIRMSSPSQHDSPDQADRFGFTSPQSWQGSVDTSYRGHSGSGDYGFDMMGSSLYEPSDLHMPTPSPHTIPRKMIANPLPKVAIVKHSDIGGLWDTQRELDEAEKAISTSVDQVGHCSFSDRPVGRPVAGKLYS